MAKQKRQRGNPIGPTVETAASNIARTRRSKGIVFADLAERLIRVGHPISESALSKLERGERRIDLDDLTALAVALETTPTELLKPSDSSTPPYLTGLPNDADHAESLFFLEGQTDMSAESRQNLWVRKVKEWRNKAAENDRYAEKFPEMRDVMTVNNDLLNKSIAHGTRRIAELTAQTGTTPIVIGSP